MRLDELGLSGRSEDLPLARLPGTKRSPIKYLHIYEDEEVSLGIFCLPKGACIPLHNHPGMTVLSRVLVGELHVLSFDWAPEDADAAPGPGRAARRVLNRVLRAGDMPAMLLPESNGNIHQFMAVSDCAVLDLLTPPYDMDEGRDCTYYRVVDAQGSRGHRLVETEPPSDFAVVDAAYQGRRPSLRLSKALLATNKSVARARV